MLGTRCAVRRGESCPRVQETKLLPLKRTTCRVKSPCRTLSAFKLKKIGGAAFFFLKFPIFGETKSELTREYQKNLSRTVPKGWAYIISFSLTEACHKYIVELLFLPPFYSLEPIFFFLRSCGDPGVPSPPRGGTLRRQIMPMAIDLETWGLRCNHQARSGPEPELRSGEHGNK